MNKTCSKCGKEKGLKHFDKNPGRKHDVHSQCKDCKVIYRLENAEKIKAYRQTGANKESRRIGSIKYRLKFPHVGKATGLLNRAVRLGEIIPSDICSACNKKSKTEAHHHDYSKPLEVVWLCRGCHIGLHVVSRL
jgi:hypothetical protein